MVCMLLSVSSPGEPAIVLRNCRLASLAHAGGDVIDDGAVVIESGRITYAGPRAGLPAASATLEAIDLGGRLMTPALIDCHTHIVHGGHRAREFEMRLNGASYLDIAKAGGGIVSTVRSTRALSVDELVAQALPRLDSVLAEGLGTIEVKSGYGLTIESELAMLKAARALADARRVRVVTSYLAAHALPAEYKERSQVYIDDVVIPGLRIAHAEGLVDAVDGFCEGIAFSPGEIAQVFAVAKDLGIPVKLHAEQLSWLGGARLAASFGALSADHLEYIEEGDAQAMAAAGTVAVILPGAFYAIRETKKPDVAALRRHGVDIAVATDCNPGTSPLTSLLLAMNMASTFFGLTVDECLAGVTRTAARALGLHRETGTLEVGKSADLAIWNCETPAELVYRIGFNPLHARIFKGESK